jgi:hypothetical protein
LIIFQRARRVGRVVRCLFLSILKQLGLRPFSNKTVRKMCHVRSVAESGRAYHAGLCGASERSPLPVFRTVWRPWAFAADGAGQARGPGHYLPNESEIHITMDASIPRS